MFDHYLFMPIFSFLYFLYASGYQIMLLHGKFMFSMFIEGDQIVHSQIN